MGARHERVEDLFLEPASGPPVEEGQVRRVGNDIQAFVDGAAVSLITGTAVNNAVFACSQKEPAVATVVPAGVACFAHKIRLPLGGSIRIEAGGSLVLI